MRSWLSAALLVTALAAAVVVVPPAAGGRPTTGGFTNLPLSLVTSTLSASLAGVDTSQIQVDASQVALDVKQFKATKKGGIVATAQLRGSLLLRDSTGSVIGSVGLSTTTVTLNVTSLSAACTGNLSFAFTFGLRLSGATVTLSTSVGTLSLSLGGSVTLRGSASITATTTTAKQLICDIAHLLPVTTSTVSQIVDDLNRLVSSFSGLTTTLDVSALTAALQSLDLSQLQLDTSGLTASIRQFQVQGGTIVAVAQLSGTIVLRDATGAIVGTVDLGTTTVTLVVSSLRADCSGSLSFSFTLGVHLSGATITLSTSIGTVTLSLAGDVVLHGSVAITGATGTAQSLICDIAHLLPIADATIEPIVDDLNSLLASL